MFARGLSCLETPFDNNKKEVHLSIIGVLQRNKCSKMSAVLAGTHCVF